MAILLIVGAIMLSLCSIAFGICIGLYAATEEKQIKTSEALKNYYS